jgi:uncharacterized protein (TIGR03790 family)
LRSKRLLALVGLFACGAHAEGLVAARLAVVYNLDNGASRQVAMYYAAQREIPSENVLGIHLPDADVVSPEKFGPIRARLVDRLPTAVQSLVLVWSKPYAVGCMSITSAFAAGYRPGFCTPGCVRTLLNPLFESERPTRHVMYVQLLIPTSSYYCPTAFA